MTAEERRAKIAQLASEYNEALMQDPIDAGKLARIEENLKSEVADAKKAAKDVKLAALMQFSNPMLEAAKDATYIYDGYTMTREDGIVVLCEPSDKSDVVSAVELTSMLCKACEVKGHHYDKCGVVTNFHSWEYMAEKFAYMLSYRLLCELGGSKSARKDLLTNYHIREIAKKADLGETPVSNTKMVATLQKIMDALVFSPCDKEGLNLIHVTSHDVKYLLSIFQRKAGYCTVEVLKGRRIKEYIFEVARRIVNGDSYAVKFQRRKDSVAIDESEKVSTSQEVSASEKAESKPDEVLIPTPESIPSAADKPDEVSTSQEVSASPAPDAKPAAKRGRKAKAKDKADA